MFEFLGYGEVGYAVGFKRRHSLCSALAHVISFGSAQRIAPRQNLFADFDLGGNETAVK